MKEPKNILLLTDDLNSGGVTRHVLDLKSELQKFGLNIYIGTCINTGNHESPNIINLPLFTKNKKSVVGFIWSIFILRSFVINNKIEIIHSHKRYSDLLAKIVSSITNSKHISTIHNTINNYLHKFFTSKYKIVVSQFIKNNLNDNFKINGINIFQIKNKLLNNRTSSKNITISKKKNSFCWIGYLSEVKNIDLLIDALSFLVDKLHFKNFNCFIKILPNETDIVNNKIDKLNLNANVKIVSDEVNSLELLNSVSFAIMTSKNEGGSPPYLILEAAKIKKPVISTNVGDISEFIKNNKNGIIVEQNAEELANSILILLKNKTLAKRLGNNAYSTFLAQQKNNFMIEETLKVYKFILNNN